uniref:RNA-dependent RNA polymerase n=1 Tax=Bovine picobirnavirus TaxID=1977295 RepID=A0A4Y1KFS5_9VIRU|nr:RNA-dependent RNA polymerase [Bovine picobirnavirus]
MSKSETKFGEYFNLPNPGLRAYFDHVASGQPDEYRTPFYKGKSIEELLQGWDDTLKTIKNKWPSLYDYEIDLRRKVGPMSVMKPLSERMSDIESYYDSILLESKPISEEAIRSVISEWGRNGGGLRIRGVDRTVNLMKKSTNSGAPYFSKRRAVTSKTVPYYLDHNMGMQELPTGPWKYTAVLGWRGQEGGPLKSDVKQRVVWMFPYAVNIEELRVYQPLIEMCQRFNLVPAWVSMDAVDKAVTTLFDTKGKDDLVICTDFSKFDQHFNSAMQHASSQIIGSLFKGDETISGWLNNCFPIKYDIPLAYDWNKVRYGAHGMGSGSGGTNADETMAHRALQYEAALLNNSRLNPASQCLGDDGIISYPGCTVEQVVQAYSSHGQEMNPDKQYASKHDCVYLRRWHHQDYRVDGVCVGVYSTYRALGRLAEQERYYDPEAWGPKMVALRQLSILENVKYHPLREEFVSYCMKGDKFRLGLDIPGFLDDIESIAREAIEHMPDFLGYTKSLQLEGKESTGIQNWWIVQYLKSLA